MLPQAAVSQILPDATHAASILYTGTVSDGTRSAGAHNWDYGDGADPVHF